MDWVSVHSFGPVWVHNRLVAAARYPTKWDSKCLLRKYDINLLLLLNTYKTIFYILCSLDPIRKYEKETITLELPGDKTIFDIDWISIYDLADNENFGHVLIADNLNVPPSLVKITPYEFSLPNCRQLHKNLQVSWEVFGPQITLQLSGQVEKNDYMSFGMSGSETSSQMIGADVVVAYIDDIRGYSVDYNITSLAPVIE